MVIILLPISVFAASYDINKKGFIVFNFDNDNFNNLGWNNSVEYNKLTEWGKEFNMTLIDDKKPVANRKASFVAPAGATFKVYGLKPHVTYNLWIDFVSYKFTKMPGISSRLKIYADNRQIDEIVWGNYNTETMYKIEIPLDLTYDGEVSILIKEFSLNYGYWGMWDLIISSGDLPDSILKEDYTPANLETSDLNIVNNPASEKKEQISEKKPVIETKNKEENPAAKKKKPVVKKPATKKPIVKKPSIVKSNEQKETVQKKDDFSIDKKSDKNIENKNNFSDIKVDNMEEPKKTKTPNDPKLKEPTIPQIPDVVMPDFKK